MDLPVLQDCSWADLGLKLYRPQRSLTRSVYPRSHSDNAALPFQIGPFFEPTNLTEQQDFTWPNYANTSWS